MMFGGLGRDAGPVTHVGSDADATHRQRLSQLELNTDMQPRYDFIAVALVRQARLSRGGWQKMAMPPYCFWRPAAYKHVLSSPRSNDRITARPKLSKDN
jgi:hypothetical protein